MLKLQDQVLFGSERACPLVLRNFSPPEPEFIWSERRWCELAFDLEMLPRGGAVLQLVLDLDVYRHPPELPGQHLLVYCNGYRAHTAFVEQRSEVALGLRAGMLQLDGNLLLIDLPDATAPSRFGAADGRQLGIQLYGLTCRLGE